MVETVVVHFQHTLNVAVSELFRRILSNGAIQQHFSI